MRRADLNELRRRFNYACGYCSVTETSVGGELTVDHFQPRIAGGSDDIDNLVYACQRCNSYKHRFWPTEEEAHQGHHLLHPLRDNLAQHIQLNYTTGKLESLTPTGDFHITLLQLNRPQLVKHRLARQLEEVVEQKLALFAQQNREMRNTVQTQQRYITLLEALLQK
ncbi:MAG: HNH endonuclease [Caldilineaceae bacterium]|nr:HNH endonuclease [Caldilineaceae bacterium]